MVSVHQTRVFPALGIRKTPRGSDHPNVILYTRHCARQLLMVIANKSDEAAVVELPEELERYQWDRILTNYPDTIPSLERSRWLPWECEVYTRTY